MCRRHRAALEYSNRRGRDLGSHEAGGAPYVEAAWPGGATEGDGYGAAVSFAGDRAVALGPSNGPLWDVPGGSGQPLPSEDEVVEPVVLFWQPRGTLWKQWTPLPVPDVSEDSGYGSALASLGTLLAVGAPRAGAGVVFVQDLSFVDGDSDTLPDFSGRSSSASIRRRRKGPTGPRATRTVTASRTCRNSPRSPIRAGSPAFTNYFAEGATSTFFDTEFAIANPGQAEARVLLRFLSSSGHVTTHMETVAARSRRTVVVSAVPGMAASEFATVVESDQPVAVDRLMSWRAESRPEDGPLLPSHRGPGSHGQGGLPAPATHWFLAEGATLTGFDLFYLVLNPGDLDADVRVRYLLADGDPLERTYRVGAHSRFNIWVNREEVPYGSGQHPLVGRELSAEITSTNDVPVLVERAMYFSQPGPSDARGRAFEAGHGSAGVTAAATEWFLAEGATGALFDLFILIANPGEAAAEVEATYLLADGSTLARPYSVRAGRRFTIWVDHEDAGLADAAVSTTIRSTNGVPVVVERAMWWSGSDNRRVDRSARRPGSDVSRAPSGWRLRDVSSEACPESRTLPPTTSSRTPAMPRRGSSCDVLFEDGTPPVSNAVSVPAHSRLNVVPAPSFEDYPGNGTIWIRTARAASRWSCARAAPARPSSSSGRFTAMRSASLGPLGPAHWRRRCGDSGGPSGRALRAGRTCSSTDRCCVTDSSSASSRVGTSGAGRRCLRFSPPFRGYRPSRPMTSSASSMPTG